MEVPLDIGVGPALVALTGKATAGDRLHLGLSLSMRTVWDRPALEQLGVEGPLARETDELRRNPAWMVPDLLILPVSSGSGSAVGASWRPIAVGVPLLRRGPVRIETTAGARLTLLSLTQKRGRGLPAPPEEPSDEVVTTKPTPEPLSLIHI